MKIRKAVIPAAGQGSRMLPATKALPKEMMPIVDTPAIQLIIEELVESGIQDILIITGRGKQSIVDHFDCNIEINQTLIERKENALLKTLKRIEKLADIHFIRQQEFLGTGHAILKARKHIGNEPFAVLYGDDLVVSERPGIAQLIDQYEKFNASILAVKEISLDQIGNYGVIQGKQINDIYQLEGLVEKPSPNEAPSNLATLGRYIFEPEIFDFLEKVSPASNGEYQLTDAIQMMIQSRTIYAYAIKGEWHTIGDLLSYLKTCVSFAINHPTVGESFRTYLTSVQKDLLSSPIR